MQAWCIFSARAQFRLNKYMQLQAACENILDRNYRTFAANISAPGRNWIFTARFSL
jgi:hemoglobin/transferrin/lactoferrin receptor protein